MIKIEHKSLKSFRADFIKYYQDLGYNLQSAHSIYLENSELLFTNSGMIPFKEMFYTDNKIKYLSIQPCIRLSGKQNDLSEIGVSKYHHTSFEMIGLFQFTKVNVENIIVQSTNFLLKYLNKENLIYNAHPDDTEGLEILDKLNLPIRIDKSCVWSTNENKCMEGYSIEIYYKDNANDVEIWNMVFPNWINDNGKIIQTEKKLDMGAGLERLSSVVNKTFNNYELNEYSGASDIIKNYYALDTSNTNRIVDHMKTVTMLLSSGLQPGNKEQGYVLRKLMRIIFKILNISDSTKNTFIQMQKELFNYFCETFLQHMISDHFIYSVDFQPEIESYIKMMSSINKICSKYNINASNINLMEDDVFIKIKETHGIGKDDIFEHINK